MDDNAGEIVFTPPSAGRRVWLILVGIAPAGLVLLEVAGHLHLGPGAWAQVVAGAAFLAFCLRMSWGGFRKLRWLAGVERFLASPQATRAADPQLIAALRSLPDIQRPQASRAALWVAIVVGLVFATFALAFLAYSIIDAWGRH